MSALEDYLARITASVPADPTRTRYLITARGIDPFINDEGSYDHHDWDEEPWLWPDKAEYAAGWIRYYAPRGDVFVCPYLMCTKKREKGNAAWRQLVHCDADRGLDLAKVDKLGGFAIRSGTPGHGHVYVPLSYTLRAEQHETLCRGVVAYLDGDPAKFNDNDLLRPPETFNFKPTVTGGSRLPVIPETP